MMKVKGFLPLFLLTFLLLAVSLACAGSTDPTPAVTPIQQSQQNLPDPSPVPPTATQPALIQPTATQPPANDAGGLRTFIDQNNLYRIQSPSDWIYTPRSGDDYYIDQFRSPDGKALVENIVFDNGTAFTGSQKGKFALQLIYQFYSKTGTSSDIKITSDQIMDDGSERLLWHSKGGSYSGASYFETRAGRTTFLMFTIEWLDDAEDLYLETLDQIVESYTIP
jgi:hypothetical protein